jgi:DNA methylase
MTTRLLVGDVFERMAELEDGSFDLIVTSPPFLALRSYLPDGHPDKDKEIGSEATPAEFLDTMLALTAEWRRLLAPHGSIAIELGDTYAGSGGAGGDYDEDGLREGQNRFKMDWKRSGLLNLSLAGIPDAYALSLEYGWNVLRRNAPDSPAGRWRVRNLKPWIRSNPPVGSLGTKNMRERSATSYITVACTGTSRWFDLDAVRTAPVIPKDVQDRWHANGNYAPETGVRGDDGQQHRHGGNTGGAPPLDWWHQVDAVIDHEIDRRAGKTPRGSVKPYLGGGHEGRLGPDGNGDRYDEGGSSVGARGVHIRRALERSGDLPRGDYYDVSPRGYTGAHYAVWPPELVKLMIDEMCPTRVCVECGVPSRRITQATDEYAKRLGSSWADRDSARPKASSTVRNSHSGQPEGDHIVSAQRVTTGWSDCGHNNWRPGRILDPFSGSGTTLAVASGMGRDSVGIDLDERNAHLTEQRVGMFLEIDWGERGPTAELPPRETIDAVEEL